MAEIKMSQSTVIVGIGNPTRRDDGLGVHVVRRLRAAGVPAGCVVKENPGEWLSAVEQIAGHARAFLVDAAELGKPAGTIVEMSLSDLGHAGPPRGLTTHGPGFVTALQLGRDLGLALPSELTILAVQVADIESYSETCSPEVETAIGEVCARLQRTLHSHSENDPRPSELDEL